jgi:hypothetical protein
VTTAEKTVSKKVARKDLSKVQKKENSSVHKKVAQRATYSVLTRGSKRVGLMAALTAHTRADWKDCHSAATTADSWVESDSK